MSVMLNKEIKPRHCSYSSDGGVLKKTLENTVIMQGCLF